MRIRAKFWLESDQGGFLLGPGTLRLLLAVEERGSLKAGARAVRLGYRTAWARLNRAEKALGFPLVERRSGGEGGGGSTLTPEALELVERYRRFVEGLEEELEVRFREVFGDWTAKVPVEAAK
ncbi:MAG: LysR family transcriptional regulator [Meiothermus sp.]|uniref:winged helix-turn-helix domain-containing protein n=1 Tax=Meiothermus sp. TaxID=1955249 RepID=UPI0025FE55B4|nr:LysR family transcriptional regulator [Meiothermus sp.]MCS7059110.1 LysR family transcriptional regulator [Meiothermus sp.]MCS7195518.1 LysR family transcriptional regulator [Meiothermus sp.]MCX7741583.1 LysR family transcriptional regulator [Meiothermus sp.]MDW8090446.1 LysR family transcriptional regulator [Meiothermus sp.]